jgi:hypothetical protein
MPKIRCPLRTESDLIVERTRNVAMGQKATSRLTSATGEARRTSRCVGQPRLMHLAHRALFERLWLLATLVRFSRLR